MTVDVDYGAGRVIYNVEGTPAYTDPTSAQVQQRGDNVYGYLTDLEATADFAAASALEKLTALREFDAAVGVVSFDVPDAPDAALSYLGTLPSLVLDEPVLGRSDLGLDFLYTLTDTKTQDWAAPVDLDATVPTKPGLLPPVPLPSSPSDYLFPSVPPPTVDIEPFVPTDVAAPQIDLVDFEYTATLDIDPPDELLIDTSGLEAAIAAYESYDPTPPVLPEYLYLIPEIFTVTGNMASGDTIVDYVQILSQRDGLLTSTVPSTAAAFNRRGTYAVPGAPTYDAWLGDKVGSKLDASDRVFVAKAINDAVEAAMQLGTAAHRMLVDIETALYDLEFRAAKAAVQGQLVRAQAAAAIYNANVLILQNAIANYNAQAAAIQGAARAFEVQAREAMIIAQANSTVADSFSIGERAKQTQARVFKSQIDAEAAKLLQYRALLESYEAQVQAARSDVEQYSGDVARYAAETERLASEYELYSADMRSVQTQNAMLVTNSKADQSKLRSLVAAADSASSTAASKAITLQAKAAIEETKYIKRSLHSDEEATEASIRSSAYNLDIVQYITDLSARSDEFSGKSALARSIVSYVNSASEAVGRAATLTQTANTTLARAYEQVYAAAGRAGAAVASGKLSGFRASATMSASEALRASRAYSVGISADGANSFSEADNYSASIGV